VIAIVDVEEIEVGLQKSQARHFPGIRRRVGYSISTRQMKERSV
jgi:hypothetical protein